MKLQTIDDRIAELEAALGVLREAKRVLGRASGVTGVPRGVATGVRAPSKNGRRQRSRHRAKPREVLEAIQAILQARGPMTRDALYKALETHTTLYAEAGRNRRRLLEHRIARVVHNYIVRKRLEEVDGDKIRLAKEAKPKNMGKLGGKIVMAG